MTRWLPLVVPEVPGLDAESQRDMLSAGTREHFQRSRTTLFSYTIVAAIVGCLTGACADHPWAYGSLVGLLFALGLVRGALHRRISTVHDLDSLPWAYSMALGVMSSFLMSVGGVLMFAAYGHAAASYLAILVSTGFGAVAANITSIHLRLIRAIIVATNLPFVAYFATSATRDSLAILVLVLGYIGILWKMADYSHHFYWRAQAGVAQLRNASKRFARVSRRAGMAEVATCILHDVGNALNSLKTSVAMAEQRAAEMPSSDLGRLAALVSDHRDDLRGFLDQDARGQLVPAYLSDLGVHWDDDRATIVGELTRARHYVAHIERSIARQHEHARFKGELEDLRVDELLGDALYFSSRAFAQASVDLHVSGDPDLVANVDRHHVLEILINLLNNALDAVRDQPGGSVSIRVASGAAGDVHIVVQDNGGGIAAQDAGRIFTHGFTTKEHGHGFGLHSSLLGARAMGGDLTFTSDGLGHGTQFILRLPRPTHALAAAA